MKQIFFLILLSGLIFQAEAKSKQKPTVFIIGDSTVKHGRGDGAGGHWGWGDPIVQYFDTTKINVENHALGGTSSRTFRTKGLWGEVLRQLRPGDYVIMQFGHNDNGPLNDNFRARGTIHGIGKESQEIDNMLTHKHETVHSYGWYIRQYIIEAKEKGATPIVISPIPRNIWKDGKVVRNDKDYGKWSHEVADQEKVPWINLNHKMADVLDKMGADSVMGYLFLKSDHTHTTARGAVLAASLIVQGLREAPDCRLKNFLLDHPVIHFPVKKKVWIIGDSTVADGSGVIVGWGKELSEYFDTTRVVIYNKARGGRSSRSYRYEGLWKEVLDQLQKGDFLLIQFGHNDGGNVDKPKFRGSLKGMGYDTLAITRPDGTKEVVHTYGWYMKKYISEAKAKGVYVIVLAQIPRNIWHDGKVERADDSYGGWARKAAKEENAFFLNLNNTIATEYEAIGPEIVKDFFPKDHTHTNEAGARFNALTLARLISDLHDCPLHDYVQITKPE